METRRFQDPAAFRDAVEPYLLRDEARHNLMLGLIATLVERPDVYPRFNLWAIEDDHTVLGVAFMTPPHNLILSAPAREGVLEALASSLLEQGVRLPGVIAAEPEVDQFLEAYASPAGRRVRERQAQAIHLLGDLCDVPAPAGHARPATPDDTDLILAWSRAFNAEAGPDAPWDEERARANLRHKIPDGGGGGMRIWETDERVCLVGYVEVTPRVARVGPVYTPNAHRRRGYATALTAELSRELLARGKKRCLLYTDLANPTSNAIYHRIGYRVICNSAMVALEETT